MKGLIVYCLDRIIRRGCRGCLHWYLSVLSRLIDTLDCYISQLKTFSACFHSRFYFSPPRPPSSCNQEIWTCIMAIPLQEKKKKKRCYLAPPGVYSKSSDKSHKTWMTLWSLILTMKVHHLPLCAFWLFADRKLNCNQSAKCKHRPPLFFLNTFASYCWSRLRRVCITCVQRKHPPPPTTSHTPMNDEICNKRLDKSLYSCAASPWCKFSHWSAILRGFKRELHGC